MKNILTHLTGIVFLIAILIAVGCNPAPDAEPTKDLKKVTIYLKAIGIKGEKHLEMYDSNNPKIIVVDTLHTDVQNGTIVIWKRAKDSGIRSLKKIGPIERGEIIEEDAKTILLHKRLRYRIPDNEVERGEEEKYIIEFKDKKDKEVTPIDPYLRIPYNN